MDGPFEFNQPLIQIRQNKVSWNSIAKQRIYLGIPGNLSTWVLSDGKPTVGLPKYTAKPKTLAF